MVTRSAPSRLAMVAQSTAVLPAPITMTLRPTFKLCCAGLAGFNEFEAVDNGLFAFDSQAGRPAQAHAQHDGVELLLQLSQRDILAEFNARS